MYRDCWAVLGHKRKLFTRLTWALDLLALDNRYADIPALVQRWLAWSKRLDQEWEQLADEYAAGLI
jgi:hypothetical protein